MQGRKKKLVIYGVLFGTLISYGSISWGQTYYVQPGDSLYSIAARYGTTITALQQSNGLSSSMIYPGQALRITSTGSTTATSTNHTVKSGESLFLISKQYGVTVDQLKRANNLTSDSLLVGQRLTIPTATNSSGTGTTHRVQAGESLFLIAQRYGVTVEALKQANQISSNTIMVGQTLKIPASGSTNNNPGTNYTVKSGDSLYLIAKQYGITVDSLCKANNINQNQPLYPGQRLVIPKTTTGTSGSYSNLNLSQSDLDLLARLVSAESSGEPFEGQVAVACTILNRLRDPRYPNTVSGIIYQVDQGRYQYSPVLDGRINLPATASAHQAIKAALSGWDPSNGANGFYNPSKTANQWVRSHPITAIIGDHVFFKY